MISRVVTNTRRSPIASTTRTMEHGRSSQSERKGMVESIPTGGQDDPQKRLASTPLGWVSVGCMTETQALVVVGSTIRRGDDSFVARTLKNDISSTAVLLDFVDSYQINHKIDSRLSSILEQIDIEEFESQRTVAPFIFEDKLGRQQLAAMSIAVDRRISQVKIHLLAELTSSWDDSVVSTTHETITSTLRRAALSSQIPRRWEEISETLELDVGRINSVFLSNVLEGITRITRDSIMENPATELSRREAFEKILDTRSRLQDAVAHLESNELGTTAMATGLRNAIASCDASTASLAAMVAVVMQEQNAAQEARELDRERHLAGRDRFVAQLALALLLPSLWFGFLGTNVFPTKLWGFNVQSEISVVIAFAIGVALAPIGWFIVSRKDSI